MFELYDQSKHAKTPPRLILLWTKCPPNVICKCMPLQGDYGIVSACLHLNTFYYGFMDVLANPRTRICQNYVVSI